MILEEDFFGRGIDLVPVADFLLHPLVARVQIITAGAAGLAGSLPDARLIAEQGGEGGPLLYVVNVGVVHTFDIVDDLGGSVVAALGADEVAIVCLEDGSTQAGVWRAVVRPLL